MKIIIKNFQKKIPINPARIKKTILKVFSQEALKKSGEITICFVNDKKIRELNLEYLGKDEVTDVLAFDITDKKDRPNRMFADIVISTDTALRQAGIYKTRVLDEVNLYLVHAALHLVGYDDHSLAKRQLMRKKEKIYVNS